MATNMNNSIFTENILYSTKINIVNHNIFNSKYAQYYSQTELILFPMDIAIAISISRYL